jgi:hypothetical protein
MVTSVSKRMTTNAQKRAAKAEGHPSPSPSVTITNKSSEAVEAKNVPDAVAQMLADTVITNSTSVGVAGALATSGGVATSNSLLPAVGRAAYTHTAMVNLMADRPDYSPAMLCAHFGRPASWLASVIASEAFQNALDARRSEIADPSLTATLHERYKALAIRTSNVLMEKMNDEKATDFLVLKAGEIAMKALGMGTKTEAQAPVAPAAPSTDTLAERLMAALDRRDGLRTIDADAEDLSPHGNV